APRLRQWYVTPEPDDSSLLTLEFKEPLPGKFRVLLDLPLRRDGPAWSAAAHATSAGLEGAGSHLAAGIAEAAAAAQARLAGSRPLPLRPLTPRGAERVGVLVGYRLDRLRADNLPAAVLRTMTEASAEDFARLWPADVGSSVLPEKAFHLRS